MDEDRIKKKTYEYKNVFTPLYELKNFINLTEGTKLSLAGKILFKRDLGGLVFFKIVDVEAEVQCSIAEKDMETELFITYKKQIDLGDVVGVEGEIYRTKTNEKTLKVNKLYLLTKAIISPPEKWHGLVDKEKKLRLRFLDFLYDKNTRKVLMVKNKVINKIREFLMKQDFIEVDTPILQNVASGASATPFKTYHEALNMEVYLRCAPELFLKRLLIGGFNRVFEIGKCFRNEGLSFMHRPEFTMIEIYQTYISYENLIELAKSILKEIVSVVSDNLIIGDLNFNEISYITFSDLFYKHTGLSVYDIDNVKKFANNNSVDISQCQSEQEILETVYKKICLPNVYQPTIISYYPISPLALPCLDNPKLAQQFQIIIKYKEIFKGCLELTDAEKQKENFLQQELLENNEKVRKDDDFVESLKYAMPPAGGLGMGIEERIVTIITQSESIGDAVYFPLLRTNLS